MNDIKCPCGFGLNLDSCCGRYLFGAEAAPTAGALMRSRFTAYVLNDEDYLLNTWHPSTRPLALDLEKDMPTKWHRLEILHKQGGDKNDNEGLVEFIAYFDAQGKPGQVREISEFVKKDDLWFYLDGNVPKQSPVTTEKVGRNIPCPCGSGKKYKRCCGK